MHLRASWTPASGDFSSARIAAEVCSPAMRANALAIDSMRLNRNAMRIAPAPPVSAHPVSAGAREDRELLVHVLRLALGADHPPARGGREFLAEALSAVAAP